MRIIKLQVARWCTAWMISTNVPFLELTCMANQATRRTVIRWPQWGRRSEGKYLVMPGIAPRFAPPATAGEQVGPGLTCGNGPQPPPGEFTALPTVQQVCRGQPVSRLGECACADGLA